MRRLGFIFITFSFAFCFDFCCIYFTFPNIFLSFNPFLLPIFHFSVFKFSVIFYIFLVKVLCDNVFTLFSKLSFLFFNNFFSCNFCAYFLVDIFVCFN